MDAYDWLKVTLFEKKETNVNFDSSYWYFIVLPLIISYKTLQSQQGGIFDSMFFTW